MQNYDVTLDKYVTHVLDQVQGMPQGQAKGHGVHQLCYKNGGEP